MRSKKKKTKGKMSGGKEAISPRLSIVAPENIIKSESPGKSKSKTDPKASTSGKGKTNAEPTEEKPFVGPRKKSVLKNTIVMGADDYSKNSDAPRIPPTRAPPNFLASTDSAQGQRNSVSRTPVAKGASTSGGEVALNEINMLQFQVDGVANFDFSFSDDEIDRLAKRFMVLDQDNSGTLDIAEFMAIPELQSNNLAERIIRLFDKDKNGVVDFKEFIDGVSVFSTKSDKVAKMKFAFKVYDMDNDGYISNVDLFQTLTMMVGDTIKDVHLQEVVNRTIMCADLDEDGKISYKEFCDYIGTRSVATNSYSRLHIEI